MQPLVRRTWAPRGHTPTTYYRCRRHKRVSVIGGLSISPRRQRLGLYVHLYGDTSIRDTQVRAFLGDVHRHLRGHIIVVWDRLNAHRSRAMRAYAEKRPWLTLESLPAYAPDLNPIEGVWAYVKHRRLANHAVDDLETLTKTVAAEISRARTPPQRLQGFVRHTGLPIRFQLPSLH